MGTTATMRIILALVWETSSPITVDGGIFVDNPGGWSDAEGRQGQAGVHVRAGRFALSYDG